MVKKFSKASAAAGTADSNLLGTVKESSSQIWLAGLGAFAKAQEEGSKVFEALVKEGAGLQKKFRQFADAQVSDVTNEVSGKITEAKVIEDSVLDFEALKDLDLDTHHSIRLRIGVKPDAKHPGGINIFGRGFGNYDQDIVLRLETDE